MYKKLLKRFVDENEAVEKTPTAAALAHFTIMMDNATEHRDEFQETLSKAMFEEEPDREERVMAERKEIESAVSCEQIVRFMRRNTDPLNHHFLIRKALEFESEIVPDIIRRLKTSLNDRFIEVSVRILAQCERNVSEEMIACFDEIRNPYVQSVVLIMLGYTAEEAHIPWFIEKYGELKKRYPHETFYEGAYYGLVEMENRFY